MIIITISGSVTGIGIACGFCLARSGRVAPGGLALSPGRCSRWLIMVVLAEFGCSRRAVFVNYDWPDSYYYHLSYIRILVFLSKKA